MRKRHHELHGLASAEIAGEQHRGLTRQAPGGEITLQRTMADQPVCRDAVDLLVHLFGARGAKGVRMAIDSLRLAVPPERVAAVCVGFVREVRGTLDGG